ncbi:MAG: hypothetical protein ACRDTA_12690 [Pseudonocardiaceae bacterium]
MPYPFTAPPSASPERLRRLMHEQRVADTGWATTAPATRLKGQTVWLDVAADTEPDIESELIDLGAISMTALRQVDDTAFRRALRHVMEQAAHPHVTVGGGSGGGGSGEGERVD